LAELEEVDASRPVGLLASIQLLFGSLDRNLSEVRPRVFLRLSGSRPLFVVVGFGTLLSHSLHLLRQCLAAISDPSCAGIYGLDLLLE
jgi:hypothetical protein